MKKVFYLLFATLFVAACNHAPKKDKAKLSNVLYQPRYAQSFYFENCGDEKVLHVFNPWQGAKNVELKYYLYPRTKKLSDTVAVVNYIPIPVQRVVCLSTTHIAYIDCLQQTSTIVGVSGAGYVSNNAVRTRFSEGHIHDVGYETLLSYETIVSLQPDVVFAYGVNGEMTAVTRKLNKLGVRVVYFADYLEESPLGKAEYMVAMAEFYNKEREAIALFSDIAAEYNALAQKVQTVITRPKVILNAPWCDTWFVPGKENYMIKLLYDAGAQPLGVSAGRGSKQLSLEAAYMYALQADYWLHPSTFRSLQELKDSDNRFANVAAVETKEVYNNTRRSTAGGGSDFWESGVVNPHIILYDLVSIFHPEILPEHTLVYYEQLQ